MVQAKPQLWPSVKAMRVPSAVPMSGHTQGAPGVWVGSCAGSPASGSPARLPSLTDVFAALCWLPGGPPGSPWLLGAASPRFSGLLGRIPVGPHLGVGSSMCPCELLSVCQEFLGRGGPNANIPQLSALGQGDHSSVGSPCLCPAVS